MAEAIATAEDDSSISISEGSFVVLGQGSLAVEMNDGGTETMNSPTFSLTNEEHQENGSINGDLGDVNSPLPGPSSIGIQLKLEKLVKENLLLKETLNQSNLAMKNQFDTLTLWHEEVVKTHESHKQKFQETQEQIFKLRNENMNLKKLIQQNLETCCGSDSSLLNLDPEGFRPPPVAAADKNSREAESQDIHIRELKMKNRELEKRMHDIAQEKFDLEEKLQKALEENTNLEKEIAGLKTDARAESKDPKSLTGDGNGHQDNEKSCEIISLDSEMPSMHKLVEGLVPELLITACKQNLKERQRQFGEQSEMSQRKSEKLEDMTALYEQTVAELKHELQQSKTAAQVLTDKIASLNAELTAKDEQLGRKADEIEQIKKEMQKLVLECEEVAILRAQVELYQCDFIEERKAREQAVGEKEKMAQQVRFLERSLSDFEKRGKENEKKASAAAAKEEKAALSYICPKCMKRLPTLTQCESHVDACLDSDMFP